MKETIQEVTDLEAALDQQVVVKLRQALDATRRLACPGLRYHLNPETPTMCIWRVDRPELGSHTVNVAQPLEHLTSAVRHTIRELLHDEPVLPVTDTFEPHPVVL